MRMGVTRCLGHVLDVCGKSPAQERLCQNFEEVWQVCTLTNQNPDRVVESVPARNVDQFLSWPRIYYQPLINSEYVFGNQIRRLRVGSESDPAEVKRES